MTILYRGNRLSIEKKSYQSPNGKTRDRVVVKPADAAAILPLQDDFCYLIRQYRFAVDEYLYEAPAGTMDPGETPEETAHRELREETGLVAGWLLPRGFVYSTPGFTTEKIYLFEAGDLSLPGEVSLDEDEVIEPTRLSRREVLQMTVDGRIRDAKTICLIHRCLR
ncbi:MAG: NUDIX hydrolase [Methanomicrobiales archaeon]|nr:NUDIX hydrolase [Methanomicrobiales archaeon]